MKKKKGHRRIQKNSMAWIICAILFLPFPHKSYAQVCLDTYKVINTQEDWNKIMDSLFYGGIVETSEEAWAVIRIKVDESGKILSAHIIKSANIETSMFYRICSTIEDCYYTPFLRNEYMTYQDHLTNGYLYANYMFKYP